MVYCPAVLTNLENGFIPVDCDVLMAAFDSYEVAAITLEQLSPRSRRRDDF
jgi:hypothetical protein